MVHRFYHALNDDYRRCTRCTNRSQLFGSYDTESHWEGYCSECNARWYGRKLNSILQVCNRKCSAFPLLGLGLNNGMACEVRKFLNCCDLTLRFSVLLKHRLNLTHLLWLVAPLHWWLCATDSEAEEERYMSPSLYTLKEVYIKNSSAFRRYCIRGLHGGVMRNPTILDAVSLYLEDVPKLYRPEYSVLRPFDGVRLETSWSIWQWDQRHWVLNTITKECFYIDNPPSNWRQYWYYFDCQSWFSYWWDVVGKRCFMDPTLRSPSTMLTSSTGVAADEYDIIPRWNLCADGRRRWSCELEDNLRLILLGEFDEDDPMIVLTSSTGVAAHKCNESPVGFCL
jgi:hypothetical protein